VASGASQIEAHARDGRSKTGHERRRRCPYWLPASSSLGPAPRDVRAACIVEIDGNKEIAQIQVHPGGGRHSGAYIKISTNQGIVKVVDPATYQPTPGEKATIVDK
jgi:hypothetical protein